MRLKGQVDRNKHRKEKLPQENQEMSSKVCEMFKSEKMSETSNKQLE